MSRLIYRFILNKNFIILYSTIVNFIMNQYFNLIDSWNK